MMSKPMRQNGGRYGGTPWLDALFYLLLAGYLLLAVCLLVIVGYAVGVVSFV